MKIAFYVEHKGWYEWIIRVFTGSPTHCELVFSDGMWFSASNRDGGTRFKRIEMNPDNWILVDLPYVSEDIVRAKCTAMLGCEYDFLGVLLGWAGVNSSYKWFCSEACLSALQSDGMLPGVNPCRVSPAILYEMLGNYAKHSHNS